MCPARCRSARSAPGCSGVRTRSAPSCSAAAATTCTWSSAATTCGSAAGRACSATATGAGGSATWAGRRSGWPTGCCSPTRSRFPCPPASPRWSCRARQAASTSSRCTSRTGPADTGRGRTRPTRAQTPWPLSPEERVALIVLGQRYLYQDPHPQPLTWQATAARARRAAAGPAMAPAPGREPGAGGPAAALGEGRARADPRGGRRAGRQHPQPQPSGGAAAVDHTAPRGRGDPRR